MSTGESDFDVLIVGAGLSGIAAGYYVQARLPRARFAGLEARESLGGTWTRFRYPGVRSDSDMHTLGYSFHPWNGDVALADGPSIAAYVAQTAREYGVDRRIRYRHHATSAAWSSRDARWSVEVLVGEPHTTQTFTCRFLYLCTGYYDYANGYVPEFPGVEAYRGALVHPQAWPESLDYAGKRVVVIGSGATAVTLVPAMAAHAAHVTMLQRSPGYVVSLPGRDLVARALYRTLPSRLAHAAVRWKNVIRQIFFYALMRRFPQLAKRQIKRMTQRALGAQYDVERHFSPRYEPWDQRLCFVPNGDLFETLRAGSASIVTGSIERFTERGIRLRDGSELDADVVVTATGLNMKLLGGIALTVDGVPVSLPDTVSYKGMMFCGVPNLALALGYTNASWTLKCELTARYVCRLFAYMAARGYAYAVAAPPGPGVGTEPAIALTSGYVLRALHRLPKQGTRAPWKLHQNYALDLAALRFGRLDDGVLSFVRG